MCPLEEFETEIGLEFEVKFQGEHVINVEKQLSQKIITNVG